MKSKIVSLFFILSFLLPISLFFARPSSSEMRFRYEMGMRPWRMDERCWKASDLNLSSDQVRALELLHQTHLRETRLLKAELFLRRLELRELFTNPSIKAESIRFKYAELNELQNKIEERAIDYLIKVKSLLTQEQLKNWCPEQEFPLFRQIMQRKEPMVPKPLRKPSPHERWRED